MSPEKKLQGHHWKDELSVVFMVALQAWLARLGNRSTNGSTAFKKRRGVARTLLE
jgi:hypothetical protein